ncbi:MAG: hypothetical protein K1X68_05670 [Saprospiraceae bacterium]|nr:hypothetical protein [Saprospiraceae bacterium]HMW40151.1 hypothetical protein [Saprospiraceae bacterium]HMX88957.1 hypothetical protein [Saprospiraceae bacterium]HMZ40164.1 hypothetical protein [Saprospiraceae bacterium]HNA64904.1 hypothetical protein [Saprospiraceae bacterium]
MRIGYLNILILITFFVQTVHGLNRMSEPGDKFQSLRCNDKLFTSLLSSQNQPYATGPEISLFFDDSEEDDYEQFRRKSKEQSIDYNTLLEEVLSCGIPFSQSIESPGMLTTRLFLFASALLFYCTLRL